MIGQFWVKLEKYENMNDSLVGYPVNKEDGLV
jgi:hypothetical protein